MQFYYTPTNEGFGEKKGAIEIKRPKYGQLSINKNG
jgi:hypothetical protein